MRGKRFVSMVLLITLFSLLTGCSGLGKATKNLEEAGYTLEENQDFVDGLHDDELAYVEKGYIIYDSNGSIVGSIIVFKSRGDLRDYVEEHATESEIENLKDNFYRELFIVADDDIIKIIKD